MLSHSGPLGLAYCLLNAEPLPFSSVSTEDHALMQLKTVLEGHSRLQMPPFGHLTVYSSPRVMLMHLAANTISSGLQIAGQEVPQLLVHPGNCLVMSLLGFLEHLLGLLNLHIAGLNVNIRWDSVPGSSGFEEILQRLGLLLNSLSKFLHFASSPSCLMMQRTATMCERYSSVFPWE